MILFPSIIKVVTISPTVDTSAYGSGDAISSLQSLPTVFQAYGGQVRLSKVVIVDKAKQSSALKLLFFDAVIANTADNAALDPTDAELANHFVGHIAVATTDYVALNDNSVGTVNISGGMVFKAANSRNLYVQIQSAGTPTFAAATDLKIRFEFEQQ